MTIKLLEPESFSQTFQGFDFHSIPFSIHLVPSVHCDLFD